MDNSDDNSSNSDIFKIKFDEQNFSDRASAKLFIESVFAQNKTLIN
jgi:hypothetical protein